MARPDREFVLKFAVRGMQVTPELRVFLVLAKLCNLNLRYYKIAIPIIYEGTVWWRSRG
jgi:hypothetical protein